MFIIYHYHNFMGVSGVVFDMTVPTEKIAEEWIAEHGNPSIRYNYEKVGYYFGKRTWQGLTNIKTYDIIYV